MQLILLSNMETRLTVFSNMQVRRTCGLDFGISVPGMTPLSTPHFGFIR